MSEQLSLPLFYTLHAFQPSNWIVAKANLQATKWLQAWPFNTPAPSSPWQQITWLSGPAKCGKTHLAHLWQAKTNAKFLTIADCCRILADDIAKQCYILDNIHLFSKIEEEALFHFINNLVHQQGYLMITHTHSPHQLPLSLPDLTSRLRSSHTIQITLPDADPVHQLLQKLFKDRQINVAPEVSQFLSTRIERSYEAVHQIVEVLDVASFHYKRALSIPFIKEILHLT
ncbi:MAG: HdaA/DnaA family protein [Burkholderiales bacterium]